MKTTLVILSKLVDLKLKLGLAESCACELYEAIKKANEAIREMILRKEKPDA